jgi:adenosine kinase
MNIVLTGSVAYDYLMVFPGYFRDYILLDKLESISLSFLVESMVKLRGGIATNIAYTMALLGEHPRLVATVGEDFQEYRQWLESKGVDTSWAKVIPGEYTASFFANTDRSNAQISSFYPGAMAHAAKLSLRVLKGKKPDLVVISPNDPQAMKQYVVECQELGYPYLYDPSQQIVRFSSEELRLGIQESLALFVNDYEFALIQKITGMSLGDILQCMQFMVVTQGEKGAVIYCEKEEINIPVVVPERIVDPTGVGDAFRAGFLTGYAHKLDLETCGHMGALSATYCLEQRGPQGHSFAPAEFVARYRRLYDDHDKLDVLLRPSP